MQFDALQMKVVLLLLGLILAHYSGFNQVGNPETGAEVQAFNGTHLNQTHECYGLNGANLTRCLSALPSAGPVGGQLADTALNGTANNQSVIQDTGKAAPDSAGGNIVFSCLKTLTFTLQRVLW